MENIAETSPLSCSTALSPLNYSALSNSEQEQLLQIQQDMLELIARGGEATNVVNQICLLAEHSLSNAVASVMVLDSNGLLNVFSAPSIPAEGAELLNGLHPSSSAGSCGNAVFHKEHQFVEDTFTDPRWEGMRDIAKGFNICSCWSMPILSDEGDVLGSFALSSFEHRTPSNFHHKLLEIGASVIAIILQRKAM